MGIVAFISFAKRQLCKQLPLLGNASNIHARYNKRTVFHVVRSEML
jgi:hypothetical protein